MGIAGSWKARRLIVSVFLLLNLPPHQLSQEGFVDMVEMFLCSEEEKTTKNKLNKMASRDFSQTTFDFS